MGTARFPRSWATTPNGRPTARSILASEVPFRFGKDEPELARTLKQFALAAWTLFGFTGYASVDFRVDLTGAPFIIDVNPNPFLRPDLEFATAAAEAGLSFHDLIDSIIEISLEASKASLLNRAR